jgi:chloramphenicol-sensitive protein RarD
VIVGAQTPAAGDTGATGPSAFTAGLLYGLAAHVMWGLFPLYFKALPGVAAEEVLAHRVFWSAVLMAAVAAAAGKWPAVRQAAATPGVLPRLLLSAVLIANNWYVYIYGVTHDQVLQTSLGYFITPLFNVALGLLCYRERLRPAQWAAVALAASGVLNQAWAAAGWPWIALSLATSFSLYGLLRKATPVDALIGLTVETLVLGPVALGYLVYLGGVGRLSLAWGEPLRDALLVLTGIVTALPLLCFGQAARRLPLSTLGFLQYVGPTLQFLLAVYAFREPLPPTMAVSFGCIWAALGLYSFDLIRHYRRPAAAVGVTPPGGSRRPT